MRLAMSRWVLQHNMLYQLCSHQVNYGWRRQRNRFILELRLQIMMLHSWKSRNNDQQAYHTASICTKSIPHQLPTTSSENSLRDKISHIRDKISHLHLLTCIPLAIESLSSILHAYTCTRWFFPSKSYPRFLRLCYSQTWF